MNIVEIAVEELREYENNPRHNDDAVEAVAASIREFGFKVPVVVDRDNVIVAGHTRVRAAQQIGLETVPCIVADDLNDEQIRAFRLADNKTAELAGWDFGKLEEELSLLDMDMSVFGFEDHGDVDIDKFFDEAGEKKEKGPKTVTCPHCGETFEL